MQRLVLVALAVTLVAACGRRVTEPQVENCTSVSYPGLLVRVRDSVTRLPAARGATLTASYAADSSTVNIGVTAPDDSTFLVYAFGRLNLRIQKPGYADWARDDLVVVQTVCIASTDTLTALLAPLP